MSENMQKHWEEFVTKHLSEFGSETLKLKDGDAEKILSLKIDEWLKEGDIQGTKILKENFQRLSDANMLAIVFFNDCKDVEFDFGKPNKEKSSTSTHVTCSVLEFEKIKRKENEKSRALQELMKIVDYFSVDPIDGKTISVTFSVDDIWIED